MRSLEMWVGIECTVNRVGDCYFDQLLRSGHHDRIEDLDLIAWTGARRVRYPVLWERTARGALADADWSWPDARLARLQQLGIDPIAGLVHHGSGPAHTSLVDDAMPGMLAAYAGAVARRYPWLTAYTPINEPLTTARFSGLYGHWYPHGRDDRTFARALILQCRAIVLAMRAIRAVRPDAQLISTEDLGFCRSTPSLAYQAEFENERRWLSLDLLSGRVDAAHPLRSYLRGAGVTDAELDWFLDANCRPDIIGVNYYVTSERVLDAELARHPVACHGGNGIDRYADVEAVRTCGLTGLGPLVRDVYARYATPIAVTEAHLASTREEQLRWFLEIYDSAVALREQGIPVNAVTAWSAFGSFDWHCLVTRAEGRYEPGLFDIRSPRPRATAVARAVRALASGARPDHPVLSGAGWWHRSAR
jgi:dTDP-4-dehydrorhamnose reductase